MGVPFLASEKAWARQTGASDVGRGEGRSDHTCTQLIEVGLVLVAAPVAGERDGAETVGRDVGSKQQ